MPALAILPSFGIMKTDLVRANVDVRRVRYIHTPHLSSPHKWLRTVVNYKVAYCASAVVAASPIACLLLFRGFRVFVLCASTLYL